MSGIDQVVQSRILKDIAAERKRQDRMYGMRNSYPPERWLVILVEEVGEVSNAILEHSIENYEMELIHVAAVAVAAVESLRINQALNKGQKE